MKNNRMTLTTILTLTLLGVFACASENDETPVTIDNTFTETVTYSSEISVGDHSFTKEAMVQFTISAEGEILSSEVLSRTLDGVEMEQIDNDSWSVSVVLGSDEGSTLPTTQVSGAIGSESEDCDIEYNYLFTLPNPIGEDGCVYWVEEVCWLSGYDSEGIYTVVMTVDDRYEVGNCDMRFE